MDHEEESKVLLADIKSKQKWTLAVVIFCWHHRGRQFEKHDLKEMNSKALWTFNRKLF